MSKSEQNEVADEIFAQSMADFITRDLVDQPTKDNESKEDAEKRVERRAARVRAFAAQVAPMARVAAEAMAPSE